jgi:16S rRNA processing protein RimM
MSQARANSAQTNAAGSPLPGEPVFLAIGKLRRAHGVHGEILMEVFTDFPERIKPGALMYLGSEHTPMHLLKYRGHREGLLISLEGYSTPEEVGELRNLIVYVSTADRPPLPEGEYYHHQLIGLRVLSDTQLSLGTVAEILETGASDVLVVRPEHGPEVLIPLADAFILEINLARGEIIVHIIPGMLAQEA